MNATLRAGAACLVALALFCAELAADETPSADPTASADNDLAPLLGEWCNEQYQDPDSGEEVPANWFAITITPELVLGAEHWPIKSVTRDNNVIVLELPAGKLLSFTVYPSAVILRTKEITAMPLTHNACNG